MNNQAVIEKPKRAPLWKSLEWCAFSPSRINRVRYFGLSMFWLTICFLLAIIGMAMTGDVDIYLLVILGLILIPNTIILNIRRIHDINLSGWWLLLGLIPYVGNILVWLVLLFWPGTKGENKFGEKAQPATKRHYFMFLLGVFLILWAAFITGFYSKA